LCWGSQSNWRCATNCGARISRSWRTIRSHGRERRVVACRRCSSQRGIGMDPSGM